MVLEALQLTKTRKKNHQTRECLHQWQPVKASTEFHLLLSYTKNEYGEAATWYISRKTYVRSWKWKFTFCKEPRRQSSQTNGHWLPTKVIVLEVQILTFKKEFDNVKERLTDVEGSHDDLYRHTKTFICKSWYTKFPTKRRHSGEFY